MNLGEPDDIERMFKAGTIAVLVIILASLAALAGIAYVIIHFLAKVW